MHLNRPQFSLLFFCIIFFTSTVYSQEGVNKETARPKIGLVLSGGGAKGLAHIGVLKVLEELNIKPDYITGTSMGSIVGGLYSIGYTANELDSLVRVIDWNSVFSDKVSYDKIGINVKHDYINYQINLSGNGLKDIKLPLGLVQGQLISELLSELTWRSTGIDSFDDFPIPFRCIAADIITGKAVIFDSGSLAQAIRTSMSIPSAFTPIIQDGKLLVDGGVINNFPVQECIAMGADIVIGVYVGSDENVKAKDLNTMIKIMSQSASFLGAVNAKEQLKNLDIRIIPELNGASIESFNRSREIVKMGEDAARKEDIYSQLSALADSLKLFPRKEKLEQTTIKHEIAIHKISVSGLKHVKEEFVIGMSEIEENSLVTSDMLKEALKRLYGTLIFDKIEYRFVQNGAKYDLVFDAIEKNVIKVSTSIYYDNYFGAGILVDASYKHLLVNSSKLDLILDISQFPRANLSYSLIGGKRKRLFFTVGIDAQSIVIPNFYEFPNSLIVSMGKIRNNQINLFSSAGLSITRNSKLEIKASHTSNYFYLQEGLDELYGIDKVSSNNSSIEGSFKLNTFDHPIFPTKGAKLDIIYRKILSNSSTYTTAEGNLPVVIKNIDPGQEEDNVDYVVKNNEIIIVDYKHYFRFAKRFSLIPEATLGFMSSIPFYADKFFLGGNGYNARINTFNVAGVEPFQIATDNFLKLGLGIQMKVSDKWYLNAFHQSAIFINNAETSSEQTLEIEGETISGWAASISYNSVVGPLKFILSQNTNNSEFYYYFSVGFPF